MNIRTALTFSALAALTVAAQAQSAFANYPGTAINFTRTNSGTTGTLTGSGSNIDGFVLNGITYNNVDFTFSGVSYMSSGGESLADVPLPGGSFAFKQGSTLLLSGTFDTATLTKGAFSATFDNGEPDHRDDNVVFGGLVTPLDPSKSSFTFTLADAQIGNTDTTFYYKSTFGAAGNVAAVPEPATMAALGMGALALIRRRRR